jgi:hypothetical protein
MTVLFGWRRQARATIGLLAAFVLSSGGGIANATSYTITVDVSQQTAGNPRFWEPCRMHRI